MLEGSRVFPKTHSKTGEECINKGYEQDLYNKISRGLNDGRYKA